MLQSKATNCIMLIQGPKTDKAFFDKEVKKESIKNFMHSLMNIMMINIIYLVYRGVAHSLKPLLQYVLSYSAPHTFPSHRTK